MTIAAFKSVLSQLFRIEDSLDVVARWDLPFAETCRIAASGELPTRSLTFPMSGVQALDTWESIHLASLRYGTEVSAMLRAHENKAAYELLLVRHKR